MYHFSFTSLVADFDSSFRNFLGMKVANGSIPKFVRMLKIMGIPWSYFPIYNLINNNGNIFP